MVSSKGEITHSKNRVSKFFPELSATKSMVKSDGRPEFILSKCNLLWFGERKIHRNSGLPSLGFHQTCSLEEHKNHPVCTAVLGEPDNRRDIYKKMFSSCSWMGNGTLLTDDSPCESLRDLRNYCRHWEHFEEHRKQNAVLSEHNMLCDVLKEKKDEVYEATKSC